MNAIKTISTILKRVETTVARLEPRSKPAQANPAPRPPPSSQKDGFAPASGTPVQLSGTAPAGDFQTTHVELTSDAMKVTLNPITQDQWANFLGAAGEGSLAAVGTLQVNVPFSSLSGVAGLTPALLAGATSVTVAGTGMTVPVLSQNGTLQFSVPNYNPVAAIHAPVTAMVQLANGQLLPLELRAPAITVDESATMPAYEDYEIAETQSQINDITASAQKYRAAGDADTARALESELPELQAQLARQQAQRAQPQDHVVTQDTTYAS